MPPSFMISLWGNDRSFVEKYITKDNKYYITGDAGYFDEANYIHIMTRIDDIINVAGHRLSTGRIEEVINSVENVVESAVVAARDDLKGELPFAFIVCKGDVSEEFYEKIKENVNKEIVHSIGPISKLKGSVIVHKLPKTRSGKILRGVLKHIINGEKYKVPGTIEDIQVIHEIIDLLIEKKIIKSKEQIEKEMRI